MKFGTFTNSPVKLGSVRTEKESIEILRSSTTNKLHNSTQGSSTMRDIDIHQMSLINANPSRRHQLIQLLLPLIVVSPQTSHFSSTPTYSLALSRLSRPRSPRSRGHQAAEQRQQHRSQSGRSYPRVISPRGHPKSTQWPTHILKEAVQTGRLAMSVKVAEAVLDDFQKLHNQSVDDKRKKCSGMVRVLLDIHKICYQHQLERVGDLLIAYRAWHSTCGSHQIG